ncbi:hypothetical protein ABVN23_25140 [Pseudomonas fluorescens]|uniref:hypothetical protein n=1 Tax=Pseudomonas fluorescens TaxID=294 RepID=UPI003F9D028C
MNRPPPFLDPDDPGTPRWRRWWQALLSAWAVQLALLWMMMPEAQSWFEFGVWSALLPLCLALALALRVLVWQIGLLQRDAYRRTANAASQRWWAQRSRSLPVQQVLLLGPVGDTQIHYQGLMQQTPEPSASTPKEATQSMLRCPVALGANGQRTQALARHLARLVLTLPQMRERRPQARGLAWLGDEDGQTAFIETLSQGDISVADPRLPLQDLADLDRLIDAFQLDCREPDDWLLCAGVLSVAQAATPHLPGEAGFVWLVSWQGQQRLHRGEYLPSEAEATPAVLCQQIQRYAGLDAPPVTSLAMDQASQAAFVEGKWATGEHQLSGHWGALGAIAPFIGMSLALLQTQESGQPCGWLSGDGEQRMAIGVAAPHDND